MKSITPSRKSKTGLMALLALGAVTHGAFGQSGTWTNEFDSVWSDATNWVDGVVASGAGNSATFNNQTASAVQVELDSSRTIGNLFFQVGTYTISNTVNTLTLAGLLKPTIDVWPGQNATLRGIVLAGNDGFVLDGGGTLNLFKENTAAANTITGGIVLSNGIVQVQGINVDDNNDANTLALGTVESVTFYNGTLNLRPAPNTATTFGVFNGNLIVPQDAMGTLILPVRWTGSAGDNGAVGPGLGGTLTGSGTFNVETKYVRNNVVGDWSAFTGQINITANATTGGDEFRYGNVLGFPNARVSMGGGVAFTFRYYPAMPASTNFPIGRLTGDNANVFLSGSPNAASTLTYDIGSLQASSSDVDVFAGAIANGAGPAALVKRGLGTLVLTGPNSYTGSTIVSNGVLQIGDGSSDMGTIGTGPITNLSALVFARGSGTLLVTAPIHGNGAITNMGLGGTLILAGSNTYSAPTYVTAGRLIVATASRATGGYFLTDSAEGFGVRSGSPNSALTISGLSYAGPGRFDVIYTGGVNPAIALVTNTGSLVMNGDVTVNVEGSGLTVGSITLMQWGSRSGAGNFVLGTLPPQVTGASLNIVGNSLVLTINATFDSTLRWVGDASAVWDIDNAANKVWREVGSGNLTNYYDGAKVRFDDTATGLTTVNILGAVAPQSVIVSNSAKPYVFTGGGIVGNATLIKLDPGTLTLTGINSYDGVTEIQGGTLRIGDGVTDGSLGSGVVTNNATLEFNLVGATTVANQIHGTGRVIQAGIGQVNLSAANTFTGGVIVRSGTAFGNNNGNAAGIGGGIRIEGGRVQLGANINNNVGTAVVITNATFQNTAAGNFNIDVPVEGTNVAILFDKTGLTTMNRTLANLSGVITNVGAGGLRFNSGGGNNAVGSDNIRWILEAGSGDLQNRNASVNFLGSLEGQGTLTAQGSGNGTVTWVVGGMNTSTTFEGRIIDGITFATPAPARLTAFTKAGTGTFTLNNATLVYRGVTTVSNGVLALTGTSIPEHTAGVTVLAPGVLNVTGLSGGTLSLGTGTTNQILAGDGTVQGNIVLGSNGGLRPGAAVGATGNLTVSGSVTLGGSHLFDISTTGSPSSDRLTAPTIVYGGALVITNSGNITGTNVFQLFSGSLSGSFSSVTTPTIPGVTFNTANLNVNGTITVVGPPGVSTTPTNITTSVSGGVLTLSWPASHQGWRLQAQTNSLSTGLATNWVDVAGSTGTTNVAMPINTSNEAVFFRLIYP
ncbi:MAG TPA: autotransporter-associated beta strand repeat-containing protein [Verrucomicrobiae bacterium]|nr:autotransporter-associated beta strand repeat-containing protein [Verrucomicrobiae bacterium]